MDPVTTAIVAAIATGTASGMANASMVEGYKGLKAVLARKSGASSKIVRVGVQWAIKGLKGYDKEGWQKKTLIEH